MVGKFFAMGSTEVSEERDLLKQARQLIEAERTGRMDWGEANRVSDRIAQLLAIPELELHNSEHAEVSNLKLRLLLASVGACSCLTKTPDIRYHGENCLYRLLTEASDAIKQLREEINTDHTDLISKEQILDELISEFTPSPREWSGQEWWDIAPWQPMDSAPDDWEPIMVKSMGGYIYHGARNVGDGHWALPDNTIIISPIGWLPLPEIKR
jgi:hypothetical protein